MKNINTNTKTVSEKASQVILNAFLAIASALTAYYFCVSPDKGNEWMSIVLLAGILVPSAANLSERHQKMIIGAGIGAAILAAAAVIFKAGFGIFNIRYFAIVFLTAAAVLAAAKAVFLFMESRKTAEV